MRNAGGIACADLHIHTSYSDGVLSPEKVVSEAVKLGLRAIAITDHDCVDGISPCVEASANTGLEVVPGVELSAAIDETEIHILGYFIDWKRSFLVEALRGMQKNRVRRMKKMVRLLNEHGVDVDEKKVFRAAQADTIGRPHLARVMVEEGMARNVKEAFDRYIGDGKPCCVKHERLDYQKAIDMIKRTGGVPVIAHPGTMGHDEYFPRYIQAGLRGVEVFHSNHRQGAQDRYLRVAEENDLLMTGGSDCHGTDKNGLLIGRVKVSYAVVEKLREEAEMIREGKAA